MAPKGIPEVEALGQLTKVVFNNIVAFQKLPFICNNIVALICSLLFLNDLVKTLVSTKTKGLATIADREPLGEAAIKFVTSDDVRKTASRA